MNELKGPLLEYCEEHTNPRSEVLDKLERETYLKTLAPQMISGFYQGRLLSFISKMIRPTNILEIGTFTGYSAICMASGLQAGGQVHAIEINDELEQLIRKYIRKAQLEEKITLYIGDAKLIVPELPFKFDLAFIDAAKLDYVLFYEMILEKINPGAFILADNVLWSGKVLDPHGDPDAEALRSFNHNIQMDSRVENILLPIRDGLMLIRKL